MAASSTGNIDGFTAPGIVKVSAAAIKFARDFGAVAKGSRRADYVIAFDWAQSIRIRKGPDQPLENVGACLMLGAYERRHVPQKFIQSTDGFDFAIKIPAEVWKKSVHRLIDVDAAELFKLTLR